MFKIRGVRLKQTVIRIRNNGINMKSNYINSLYYSVWN